MTKKGNQEIRRFMAWLATNIAARTTASRFSGKFGRIRGCMYGARCDPRPRPNQMLTDCCDRGDIAGVLTAISKGANDWNGGMVGACRSANLPLVELLIGKGASDWNKALDAVCNSSNGPRSKIIEILILRGIRFINRLPVFDPLILCMHLLQTTAVTRTHLKAMSNVPNRVFERADEIVDDLRTGLNGVDVPAVLQAIVIGYCINNS
jgi:hypothetical protein